MGALALYGETIKAYWDILFVPDVKGDLVAYTADRALDGIFRTLAVEEAAVCTDPVKRATDLL